MFAAGDLFRAKQFRWNSLHMNELLSVFGSQNVPSGENLPS